MPNALIDQTSPYLIQHAHNPVDWQPWGEEAFEMARAANKAVFLSIGYSTCHWCHVMERESFENPRVAEVMNHHFINVKVDREERPDIDALYMAFVQATTGQGGWPMSVWLTPDGKPLVGGTYFPPDDKHGRVGFVKLCHEVGRLWRDDRERLEKSADKVVAHLREEAAGTQALRGVPGPKVFGDFLDKCESMFDPKWGGFGGAPKFPRPVVVRTLMQLAERFGKDTTEGGMAWSMTERTLKAMAAGGMHDHLAGGFHRYSVDRYWHVPHYEKMLYDQAQLAMAYLDGCQISGDPVFRETAEGIFHYLLTDLRDACGAFHAAEDADSLPDESADHKREGAYWTWEAKEISALLDPRDAAIFCSAYGVQAEGNSRPESDPHGELEGQNTLFRAMQDEGLAGLFDLSVEEIRNRLSIAKETLLKARRKRPLPHRDDKIVTAWNGLVVGALARGGRVLNRKDLVSAAEAAAKFLWIQLWDGTTLYRSYRKHRGTVKGFPADHAFLISGLIELHAVLPEGGWLDWAVELQSALDANFWDASQSGYVMKAGLGKDPLLVIREDYDGAEPSPNHVAAENLQRLAMLVDEPAYAKRAEALLRTGSLMLESRSFAVPVLLSALDVHERGIVKFDIPASDDETFHALDHAYLPRSVFRRAREKFAVVCEGVTCRPLVTEEFTSRR